MKRVALCLFVSSLVVTACQGNNGDHTHNALAALKSNAPSQQYGPAFCSDEYQR